jgi:translocator protein
MDATTVGDRVRAGAVLATAVAQLVVGGLGGAGTFGESVAAVANSYPTPILPAGAAFSIWSVIYLAVLALAVRQVLPGQLARPVHRATGWWLVGAAVANAGWILLFANRLVLAAQAVIVALLVCLAVVLARLSRTPAERGDRLLLHGPVALYAGWVSVATVVGAAATGVAMGAPPLVGLGAAALLATAVIGAAVVGRGRAVLPYAAAVMWALAGIALADRPTAVVTAAVLAALVVATTAAVRVRLTSAPARVAWG